MIWFAIGLVVGLCVGFPSALVPVRIALVVLLVFLGTFAGAYGRFGPASKLNRFIVFCLGVVLFVLAALIAMTLFVRS